MAEIAGNKVPDPELAVGPKMGFPKPKGAFTKLPPSHFRVTIRKAQAWQNDQIGRDLNLTKRTVSSYLERAKDKLNADSVQDLMFMVYAEYAPELCPPYWERETGAS